ncbi:MAG: hypothetical protein WC862_04290 [Patescibacteria group bacterium]
MFQISPVQLFVQRWKLIFLAGVVLAAASVIISALFPLEYRADAQVLIISSSRYGVDPYTTVKSAERIGENIAQIVKTNDFYNKVVNQPQYTLDLSRFTNVPERTKRKRWQKTVNASVVFGTGVLNISTYHTDADEAKNFAGAVADALVSYGADYVGGNVAIKIVNQPIVTRAPVRPNVLVNAMFGFVAGVLMMCFIIVRRVKKVF